MKASDRRYYDSSRFEDRASVDRQYNVRFTKFPLIPLSRGETAVDPPGITRNIAISIDYDNEILSRETIFTYVSRTLARYVNIRLGCENQNKYVFRF